MDSLVDILAPDAVAAAMAVPNKKVLFQQLAATAARLLDVDARLVADRLSDRERLGSTGFGGGVAIPHAKIDGLPKVVGLFARLTTPIDFMAVDDMPVDIVFMLLSPTDAGVEHLKALARVSRRLRDRTFVAKLRGAASEDALYALFTNGNGRDPAG
ncbi:MULTISPECIES: PTS sugar transporter subunit IIA [Sphingomonas]|uniref:PTS system nitrogen regulatory IIA component n=2 Tax=Sphingomonas TaxID=13687 RepID=A0A7W9BRM8_9SPHN|nr:PTS sugar transporter subunit IIA [Sphingomonas prati]MBB5728832.1 PTS system nitrogen regulatory IIA component [Sphingomonas prati]GGE87175.1 PTS IIA-like nitrogen-regulatory protein PtsN [Sphingomonas prati]